MNAKYLIFTSIKLLSWGVIGSNFLGCAPKPIRVEALESCESILHKLQGAKVTWAIENGKKATDIPANSDIFGQDGFIKLRPKCPQGGKYKLNAVKDWPECSIPGHTY